MTSHDRGRAPVTIRTDAPPIVEPRDDRYVLTFEDACVDVELSPRQLRELIRAAMDAYAHPAGPDERR